MSYNNSTWNWVGMCVVPWQPVFTPSSPSRYFIHDNTFVTTLPADFGIQLLDDSAAPWIRDNRIKVLAPESEGIDATFTTGTVISGNRITGSGAADAIGLFSVTRAMVVDNDVSGVSLAGYAVNPADPGLGFSQIYVGTSMYAPAPSSHVLVNCARLSDTAIDLGNHDRIVGCTSVTAP